MIGVELMSDYHEYEITIIIRDKDAGGIYGDSQQEQSVRTIVRDESFDWDDNIEKAAEKVKRVIDSARFSSC